MLGKSEPIAKDVEKSLRAVIQPETVINQISGSRTQLSIFRASEDCAEVVRIMDRKQESMAKSLGQGHRVVRGVAGSGKTLVLVYRAKLLAKLWPNQPILVTCYTRSLAGQLRHMLRDHPNVHAVNLDRLMADVIRASSERHPGYKGDDSGDRVAGVALQALNKGHYQRFRALLVDEAQDFGTRALQFALGLLMPGKDDLLIVADAAQNVFRRKFSWKQAGIQAQGRSQILRVNYRNTKEVLEFAYTFLMAGNSLKSDEAPDLEDENTVIPPESAARSGKKPQVRICRDSNDEIEATIQQVKEWNRSESMPRSIAVLYPSSFNGDANRAKGIFEGLTSAGIATHWLTEPGNREAKDNLANVGETVVLSTVHSAKGLEFPNVILCGVWSDKHDPDTNRKLAYVGMTRASENLAVVSRSGHPLSEALEEASKM